MLLRPTVFLLMLLLAVPLGLGGVSAGQSFEIPEWPYEQEERLREVESQVLRVQRALYAARRREDLEAQEKLKKEFKSLQDERLELLRVTGQVPR